MNLNKRLNNKKKYIKCQKVTKTYLELEYFQISSWIEKSNSEFNLQQDEESLQTLLECQHNLNIKSRTLFNLIGSREFTLGNFQKALEYLQSYGQLNPHCKKTKIQISQILFRLGQIDEAEQRVLQYLEEPGLTMDLLIVLRTLMVQIYHKKQNFEKMSKYIEHLLQNEPNDIFCLVYQAEILMQNKDKQEEAINQLRGLRLQIYKDRNQFSQHSFQDLISIIQKYDNLLNVEIIQDEDRQL